MANSEKTIRIAIAAGGTGGHIMPALALAQALAQISDDIQVDFFCGNRPVELQIYQAAGAKPKVLPLGSMAAKDPFHRLLQIVAFGYGFMKSLIAIGRYDVVIGMGGYVAGPLLTAAWLRGKSIILHDSNTVLGRVNRWMAGKAAFLVCGMPLVNTPADIEPRRILQLGTPVREGIECGSREEAARAFGLNPDGFTILISGGSQGARAMNDLMLQALRRLDAHWGDEIPMQVIWTTGAANHDAVEKALAARPMRTRVHAAPTIERTDLCFAMADLFVGRSGASTLAEVTLCGVPSFLLPLPTSMENHQFHNANVLKKHGAALVFDERETDPDELAKEIARIAKDKTVRMGMSQAARKLACPDAARELAAVIVEVAKGNAEALLAES